MVDVVHVVIMNHLEGREEDSDRRAEVEVEVTGLCGCLVPVGRVEAGGNRARQGG